MYVCNEANLNSIFFHIDFGDNFFIFNFWKLPPKINIKNTRKLSLVNLACEAVYEYNE